MLVASRKHVAAGAGLRRDHGHLNWWMPESLASVLGLKSALAAPGTARA
jgi:hypothetical protein